MSMPLPIHSSACQLCKFVNMIFVYFCNSCPLTGHPCESMTKVMCHFSPSSYVLLWWWSYDHIALRSLLLLSKPWSSSFWSSLCEGVGVGMGAIPPFLSIHLNFYHLCCLQSVWFQVGSDVNVILHLLCMCGGVCVWGVGLFGVCVWVYTLRDQIYKHYVQVLIKHVIKCVLVSLPTWNPADCVKTSPVNQNLLFALLHPSLDPRSSLSKVSQVLSICLM